jgi:hypothetical protein
VTVVSRLGPRAWAAALSAVTLAGVLLGTGALAHGQPPRTVTPGRAGSIARARAPRATHHHGPLPLKMIWGPVTLPNGQSAFPTYHQLGVQVFQIDLDWATTAPTKPANPTDPNDPAYQWPAELDQAISEAAHYKIKVMLLVTHSPGWANGGLPSVWAPNNPADYANFMIAAAHRYPTVRDWMVWGEPNRAVNPDFQPMPVNNPTGPRRYALILNAGYHALKSVSKSNMVIGGDTWSFGLVEPADFVRWMKLPNGKPPPLDYYGHNPFGRRFPNIRENPYFPGGRDINDIDTLESELARIYHRRVPLWLSEFTISSDHNTTAFNFHKTRKQQAHWLTAAFRLVDSVNYVVGLGWFNLVDDPPTTKLSLTNGLLTWDLHPKPAFHAYERAP